MKRFIIVLCLFLTPLFLFGEDTLIARIPLSPGEKINRLVFNRDGSAFGAVIYKGYFEEAYVFFNGKKMGPYPDVLYEVISDSGMEIAYTVSKVNGPSTVMRNGEKAGIWDYVEFLTFVPGTGTLFYTGIMANPDGSTATSLVLGDRIEGPYRTLNIPSVSADARFYSYHAKDDGEYLGNFYMYVNGVRKYGPYEQIQQNFAVFTGTGDILYVATGPDGKNGLFLSGKRVAAFDVIDYLAWNPRTGAPSYAGKNGEELLITDGKVVYGPYRGECEDIAFSSDFRSCSFGVRDTESGQVFVYKDGTLYGKIPTLCEIIYSPDGSEIAYSTAVLGGRNSVYFKGERFDAYESMLLDIHFAPDNSAIVFKTRIKNKDYIASSAGLLSGPFDRVGEPSVSPDGKTVSFIYFTGDSVFRRTERIDGAR